MRESEDLKARLEKAIDNVPIEWTASGLFADAHTTIERLEAEVERLRAALRDLLACYSDSPPVSEEHAEAQASAHHEALIAARAALAPAEEPIARIARPLHTEEPAQEEEA